MQESRGAAPLLPGFAAMLGLALLALVLPRRSAAAPVPAGPVTYARDVAPIFGRWCVSCHGGKEPHAGLSLGSLGGVMRGGDTGPVVVPGNPDASLLLAKIERRHRPSMPPRRKLPPAAVALVRAWIAAGAPE